MKKVFTTLLLFGALILNSQNINAQCYSAVQLDGTNQYMHTPFANYTFTNFTLEMWMNSANFVPNEHYISIYQNAYLVLGGWDGSGWFDTWADGLSPVAINSGTTPSTNAWHHVAFVYNGTSQILYIDGVAVTTSATSGSVNNTVSFNSGMAIGARYTLGTQYSNTAFEDVRIWNVARTPAQLTASMNTNLVGNESGLVAYYRFEDGAGSSTVMDLTGNGNTLTLYNMDPMTDWIAGPFGTAQSTDVQSTCGPLTWIDGNTYSANNNTATYTYVGGAVGGCDSTVTLNLTVNSATSGVDAITSCDPITWIDGNTYSANNNSAMYTMFGGATNGCDSIVTLNLTINSAGQSTDTQVACDSYTWIDGNTYTASNTTATHLLPGGAANGCDSIVSLNLTVNTVDAAVTTSSLSLTANASGAQYQWVDCSNNFTAIAGATSQTYTATANGSYAVIVWGAGGCSDTSVCVAITTVSLDETLLANQIHVSPNPTTGEFAISLENYAGKITVEVLDIAGKLILTSSQEILPNDALAFNLSNEANGVYIVKIHTSIGSHSVRVVKK